jgi:hypothetical protein
MEEAVSEASQAAVSLVVFPLEVSPVGAVAADNYWADISPL